MNIEKLFNMNSENTKVDVALLIMRIGIAGLMLVHGIPKMLMLFSAETIQFPGVMGMDSGLSLTLAVFAEVFCSFLLLIGLGTRYAVLPLSVTMLIAVFYIHGADPFSNQELGLHYLLVYIILLILGGGKYSIDAILENRKRSLPEGGLAS